MARMALSRERKKFEYSCSLNFNDQLLLLTLEEVHALQFFMGVEVELFMLHPDFTVYYLPYVAVLYVIIVNTRGSWYRYLVDLVNGYFFLSKSSSFIRSCQHCIIQI